MMKFTYLANILVCFVGCTFFHAAACRADEGQANEAPLKLTIEAKAGGDFLRKEPIVLLVRLTNQSNKTIRGIVSFKGDWQSKRTLTFHIRPENKGNDPYRTDDGIVSAPHGDVIDLPKGANSVGLFFVSRCSATVVPGQYTIQGEYFVDLSPDIKQYKRYGENGKRQRGLLSNVITFNMKEPVGNDAQALEFLVKKRGILYLHQPMSEEYGIEGGIDNKTYREFLETYPHSRYAPYVAYSLAEYYFGEKEYAKAGHFYRIAEKATNNILAPTASYQIACCLIGLGRTDEGKRELRALIKKYPDREFVRSAKETIDESPQMILDGVIGHWLAQEDVPRSKLAQRQEDPVFLVSNKHVPFYYRPHVKGRTIVFIDELIAYGEEIPTDCPSLIQTPRGRYVPDWSGKRLDKTPETPQKVEKKDLPAKYFYPTVLLIDTMEIGGDRAKVDITENPHQNHGDGTSAGTYELVRKGDKWIIVKGGLSWKHQEQ